MSLLGLRRSQRMWLPPACFRLPVSCLFFPSTHLPLFHSGLSRLYRRRFCLWLFLIICPHTPWDWTGLMVLFSLSPHFGISRDVGLNGYWKEGGAESVAVVLGWPVAAACFPVKSLRIEDSFQVRFCFPGATQYHYPDNHIFNCVQRVIFLFCCHLFAFPPLCCHLAAFNRSRTDALTWLYQHRPNYFIFPYAFIRGAGSREICQFLRNKYNGNFW